MDFETHQTNKFLNPPRKKGPQHCCVSLSCTGYRQLQRGFWLILHFYDYYVALFISIHHYRCAALQKKKTNHIQPHNAENEALVLHRASAHSRLLIRGNEAALHSGSELPMTELAPGLSAGVRLAVSLKGSGLMCFCSY